MTLKVVKGTVSLMVAQAVFLLSAYVMNILLARFLGPERYGVLGIIFSILTLFQIMLITGTPRAASQVIAAGKASARQAERLSNWLLVGGGIALGGLFALAAPAVAGLLGDPSLVPYLRLSALFIPAYGLYCSLLGVVQGFRRFTSDAAAKVVYALAKAFFVVALALTPLGVSGAVLGFAAAPLLAWVALRVSFRAPQGEPDGGITLRSLFILALPFMGVSILINLASSLDLFFLKALTSDDALTGQYAAALNLAKAPALLFQSLGTVLFPTIVALYSKRDMAEIRRIARQSTRYFLLFSLPFAALVMPAAPAIMALFFGEPYRAGGPALALLVLGSLGLALASILSSVVMGISGLRISLAAMAGMVAVSAIMNPLLIPRYGALGAAGATALCAGAGALALLLFLSRRVGGVFPWSASAKCAAAALAVGSVLWAASPDGFGLIPAVAGLSVLYIIILVALKEVSRADWHRISEVLA